MEKTLQALKGVYTTAIQEVGLQSPLTRALGQLIIQNSGTHGSAILQDLRRSAGVAPERKGSEVKRNRRPFIHPRLSQPVPVSGEPLPVRGPDTTGPEIPENPGQQSFQGVAAEGDVENEGPIPVNEYRNLKVNTIVQKFGKDRIAATLASTGVDFDPSTTVRILANLLLEKTPK